MPTLPFRDGPAARHAHDGPPPIALASRLHLRRWRDLPSFFATSVALHCAAAAADGCVEVSLRARLGAREFWTLSRWRDDGALRAFVGSDAHRDAMRRFRDRLDGTSFAQWPSGTRPTWDEARERVEAEHESSRPARVA